KAARDRADARCWPARSRPPRPRSKARWRMPGGTSNVDPITVFKGKSVGIPIANIDTDQITPARYLKGTSKKLAKAFFADWRFNPDGSPKDFPLNKPGAQGASILVAGDNYGCGSSREHAAWAA